jgi:hypothetical protein
MDASRETSHFFELSTGRSAVLSRIRLRPVFAWEWRRLLRASELALLQPRRRPASNVRKLRMIDAHHFARYDAHLTVWRSRAAS